MSAHALLQATFTATDAERRLAAELLPNVSEFSTVDREDHATGVARLVLLARRLNETEPRVRA